jgi:hypothetical protein
MGMGRFDQPDDRLDGQRLLVPQAESVVLLAGGPPIRKVHLAPVAGVEQILRDLPKGTLQAPVVIHDPSPLTELGRMIVLSFLNVKSFFCLSYAHPSPNIQLKHY